MLAKMKKRMRADKQKERKSRKIARIRTNIAKHKKGRNKRKTSKYKASKHSVYKR